MAIPARVRKQTGRFALVDGIPFQLPVRCEQSPALFAVYSINPDKAASLIPGNEVHPMRLWNKGLLIVSVMNYQITSIGKYIEFSIAIACTHGSKKAPRFLPAILMNHFGTGQYVYDLPVSTEISVKGGKGIWGMPKHQANLNYIITDTTVSSQYDLDGQLVMKIEVERPQNAWFPLSLGIANYCQFRGMLMRSRIYFQGKLGFSLFKKGSAKLTIGSHPRIQPLKDLEITADPLFTAFIPQAQGILDDTCETWFLNYDKPPVVKPEGMESVVNLGLSQQWLDPPHATG